MARSDKSHGLRNKVRRFAASALYPVPGQPGHGTAEALLAAPLMSRVPLIRKLQPHARQSSASPPKPSLQPTPPTFPSCSRRSLTYVELQFPAVLLLTFYV